MLERIKPPLPSQSLHRARSLRKAATEAEKRLWFHLRHGRLHGFKFRRQHPIPPYIVDFYCVAAGLVVELDGSQHGEDADRSRTAFLETSGCRVLRFWNDDVMQQMDAVLEVILRAASDRTLTPTPLPTGEGLKSEEP